MRKKPTKSAIKLTKNRPTRNDVSNNSICSPRLRGRSTSAAPFSRSRSRCWTASIFCTFLDRQIDDIKLAFFAESFLRHRQIHQREAAAKNFGGSLFFEQRAHREFTLALTGQQSHPGAHRQL